MSTAITKQPLCDICHQRPKFGGFNYCGKTCAAQAATLCSNCHQKPKFGNFEYCGKHCAAQAQKNAPQLVMQAPVAAPVAVAQGTMNTKPLNVAKKPQQQQHYANVKSVPGPAPQVVTFQVPPPAPVQPSKSVGTWVKNAAQQIPHILSNSTNQNQPAQMPRGNSVSYKSLPQISVQPTAPIAVAPLSPAVCALPDCDEPVYVDRNGQQASDYCSMSHREEAVESGLVSPCIMCLTMPQSNVDHFCGRSCREEALSKP
ncbi:hypothetical protein C8Q75DRAFT_136159 [Abortiporus biennis]|nr:hypothetical protein C8Q75DRAFT_136159 [Abortiporus biennis]